MNTYVIATASTCDIDAEWLDDHAVPFISYPFIIDGKEYADDCRRETKELVYAKMRQGCTVTTSAVSTFAYYMFFHRLMENGDDVLYVDMSRALSSSISNCEKAIEQIRREFPNQKIIFLDSYCVTGGLRLLVKQLVRRHEEGMTLEAVAAWGEEHKREYIHRFMVEDLQWLRCGGRLSNASAFLGTLLAVKPMLYITNEGVLIAFDQAHGRRRCLRALLESMQEDLASVTKEEEITVISADDREDCEKFVSEIRSFYPSLAEANITITDLGPTICAHVGPDFLAVAYRGTGRIR